MKIEKLKRSDLKPWIRDNRWSWTPFGLLSTFALYVSLALGLPLILLTQERPAHTVRMALSHAYMILKLAFHWVED